MKGILIKAGCSFGLTLAMLVISSSSLAGPGNPVIVNATFDPPGVLTGTWEGNATDIHRGFVNEGVKGTMAYQCSATFNSGGYVGAVVYGDGLLLGGAKATRESSVLSFDIKVDAPGLQGVGIGIQGWKDFVWAWLNPATAVSASSGEIAIGDYTPGVFKTVTVPLDDPLWQQDPYVVPGELPPLFDPASRTVQFLVTVGVGSLPEPQHLTVTIDNMRITTKTPPVPCMSAAAGVATPNSDGTYSLSMDGVSAHLGAYHAESVLAFNLDKGFWYGTYKAAAANGDELEGVAYYLDPYLLVELESGSGRFDGACGSSIDLIEWTDTGFLLQANGILSTVGSNR